MPEGSVTLWTGDEVAKHDCNIRLACADMVEEISPEAAQAIRDNR
jgi:hypothetical protein